MLRSIRFNFVLRVIIVITSILLLFGYYNYTHLKNELLSDVDDYINTLIARLQVDLPQPIWDFNTDIIPPKVEFELKSKFLSSIKITNDRKEVINWLAKIDNEIVEVKDESFNFDKKIETILAVLRFLTLIDLPYKTWNHYLA